MNCRRVRSLESSAKRLPGLEGPPSLERLVWMGSVTVSPGRLSGVVGSGVCSTGLVCSMSVRMCGVFSLAGPFGVDVSVRSSIAGSGVVNQKGAVETT